MEEIWKEIPGFKAEASSLGRIKSYYKHPEGKVLKLQKGLKAKYLRVQLKSNKQTLSVHRLVALAWHENPNNYPIVNHLDHDGTNNKPSNLKWDTQKNNVNHGRRGKNTRIPELFKTVIREAYKNGHSKLAISNYFKMTDTSVRRLVQS